MQGLRIKRELREVVQQMISQNTSVRLLTTKPSPVSRNMTHLPVLMKPPVIDAEIVHEEPRTRFIHMRYHFDVIKTKQNKFGISSKGGLTIAYQRSADGKQLRYAFTFCSFDDNFSRYKGRMIAQCYLGNDEEHFAITTDPVVPNSGYMHGIVERRVRARAEARYPDLNLYKVLW